MTIKKRSFNSKANAEKQARYFDLIADKKLHRIDEKSLDFYKKLPHRFFSTYHYLLKQMPVNLKNKKILDLGSGNGDWSCYFVSKGALVTSIDISPKMIRLTKIKAKKLGFDKKITAKTCSVLDICKFKKDSFDIIWGSGILHHLPKKTIKETLAQAYKVLKKGGAAYFIEPVSHFKILTRILTAAHSKPDTQPKTISIHKEIDRPLTFDLLYDIGKEFKQIDIKGFGTIGRLEKFLFCSFLKRLINIIDYYMMLYIPFLKKLSTCSASIYYK